MAHFILRLEKGGHTPCYLVWSTIVGAPITYGLPLWEFKRHYRDEYGREAMRGLPERLKRVEKSGTSSTIDTRDETLASYENYRGITMAELWDEYVDGREAAG